MGGCGNDVGMNTHDKRVKKNFILVIFIGLVLKNVYINRYVYTLLV